MYHKHHSISKLLSVLCLVLQPKIKNVEAAVVSFTAGAERFWCCCFPRTAPTPDTWLQAPQTL